MVEKVHAYLRRFASQWWKVYTHFGCGLYGKATRKSVSSATQNGFVKNTLSTAKDKP
jgi:hypothetical protein